MTTFNELSDVTDFKTYKATLKSALGKLRSGATGVNFVYIEKFKFDDKERPLVLIDHDPKLVPGLGKKPTAIGKCKVDDDDRFVFDASTGAVHLDKAQRLFTDVGVPRAVADPDAPKSASSAKPLESETLNMKYGWTEMRTWGDEAAALIEKFDGLVGLYKSIPEIKSEWEALEKRHEAVKAAMAEMVKTRIVNTPKARNDHQKVVETEIETVRQLIADVRKQATAPVAKPKASTPPTATTAQKPAEKPATGETSSQAPKEQPQAATTTTQAPSKPALSAKEIQTRVAQTVPANVKDDAAKYAARMERELKKEFADVSADHVKAIELLAKKTWFTKTEEPKTSGKTEKADDGLTLTDGQKEAINAAMQAAMDAANGPAEMLDNDAQVALGDGITAAVGGNYPTHSRGGGHKGSFTKAKSVQQQLSNIGGILQPKVRDAINEHLAARWVAYNV